MRLILLLCAIFTLVCCTTPEDVLYEKMRKMESSPITINYDAMTCWYYDSLLMERPWEKTAKLKLIVYSDSSMCTSCYLKTLYQWTDFLDLEKKYEVFQMVFILETTSGTTDIISKNLYKSELNHPIYIDETHFMRNINPNIPEESFFHTFLLDEQDSVILIGSPLRNESMEHLLYKKIEERLTKH